MNRLNTLLWLLAAWLLMPCWLTASSGAVAQTKKKPAGPFKNVRQSVPSDYTRVGETDLYVKIGRNIDFYGQFNNQYYSSTYGDNGYRFSLQVNNGSANQLYCSGGSLDGVNTHTLVAQQGELVRVSYVLTNTNDTTVTIHAGSYADVMIGNNDAAPISRRIDRQGNTYGLSMKDGGGAQLCLLFGNGLAGVSPVSDFWFGGFSYNLSADQMVGNYNTSSNWMVENGSYDSGMGWCWRDKTIAAGDSLVLSYLLGLGDVNLEPKSDFAVTPDNPELWNDISLPHRLTLEGKYESPAGLDGSIEWADETMGDNWQPMTEMMPSGTEFSEAITVNFDAALDTHTIRFRAVDNVGNATELMPITYPDVRFHELSGLTDLTFTGDSLYQSNLSCDLNPDDYFIDGYRNNVHAGEATLRMSGVFPNTIGRREYVFNILPAPLPGFMVDNNQFTYNGQPQMPTLTWERPVVEGTDYNVEFPLGNVRPGQDNDLVQMAISGMGDYDGLFTIDYFIHRAPFPADKMQCSTSELIITADGEAHAFDSYITQPWQAVGVAEDNDAVGQLHLYYNGEPLAPADPGSYAVTYVVDRGACYEGYAPTDPCAYVKIYEFDEADWQALCQLSAQLTASYGATALPWDVSQGKAAVALAKPAGLTLNAGQITGICLTGVISGGSDLPSALTAFNHLESLDVKQCALSGDLPTKLVMLGMAGKLGTLRHLDITDNHFTGNLGMLPTALPSLRSLAAGRNHFSRVLPLLPDSVQAYVGGQTLTEPFDLDVAQLGQLNNMANLSTQELLALAATLPTILVTSANGQGIDVASGLQILTAGADGTFKPYIQLYVEGSQLAAQQLGSQKNYTGASGDTVSVASVANGSQGNARFLFATGDANFDGSIAASDLQSTILEIFGLYPAPLNFTAADTYIDGTLTVQDVVCTTDMLLADLPSGARRHTPVAYDDADQNVARVYLDGNRVMLQSPVAVAALCVRVAGQAEWTLDSHHMTQHTAQTGVVAYSLTGNTLPAAADYNQAVEIGRIIGGTLVAASLSDEQGHEIAVRLGKPGSATGITFTPADASAEQYYNLQGLPAGNAPQRGVYVTKQGKKVIKK